MLSNEFVSLGIFLFSFFLFFLLKNGTGRNLHFTRNWPKFSKMAEMIRNWSKLYPWWNEWYYRSRLHPSARHSCRFNWNGTDLITMVWTFISLLALISSIYILFFVMCVMYYIFQNRKFHVPEKTNLFEIERFGDFSVYSLQFLDNKILLLLIWFTMNTYHYFGFIGIY